MENLSSSPLPYTDPTVSFCSTASCSAHSCQRCLVQLRGGAFGLLVCLSFRSQFYSLGNVVCSCWPPLHLCLFCKWTVMPGTFPPILHSDAGGAHALGGDSSRSGERSSTSVTSTPSACSSPIASSRSDPPCAQVAYRREWGASKSNAAGGEKAFCAVASVRTGGTIATAFRINYLG